MSTKNNIVKLKHYSNTIIEPTSGELASGLYGAGRLADPQEIFDFIVKELGAKQILKNKKALVTAGPTYEAIDPVRFIGNHSSGKMGYAIAKELKAQGAEVILITGPTGLSAPQDVKVINITSASEMLEACEKEFEGTDICVMAAAVADYTVQQIATQKIKKDTEEFSINFKKTADILFTLGEAKKNQILVGFALETNNEEENAIKKLQRKNLDFIVLNSLNDTGAGFKTDTNKITIIDKHLAKTEFNLKTKKEVAKDICNKIASLI